MLVDPTGRCSYLGSINSPKQDCGKRDCPCSQRYSGFLTFCKDFGNRTLQTGEALFNNFEASFGVGLGLQAEFDIIDLLGINLGTHWDLINIALIDGKVQLTQQYESVASLTVAWDEVGAREQRTDTFWEQGTVVSETGRLYNDSLTICSTTAFLIAGISFRIGFDAIHFPEDFDKIWADWWEQYG